MNMYKHSVRGGVLLVSFLSLAACGGSAPPLYGPMTCRDSDKKDLGLAAYVPPNASSATCLGKDAVTYMLCVRELSVGSLADESNSESKVGGVKVPVIEVEAGEFETKEAKILKVEYDSGLNEARAKAIAACSAFLNVENREAIKHLTADVEARKAKAEAQSGQTRPA